MSQIIINTPDAQTDTDIANAIGKRDGLVDANGVRRAATGAEVKQHIIRYLKTMISEVDLEDKRAVLVGKNITLT